MHEEQSDMVSEVRKIREEIRKLAREYGRRGWNWNRLRGEAYLNIVTHYLERHLPKNMKLVKSAWIEGCPNELDILIVDKQAVPIRRFTNIYSKDDVRLIIEVKGIGIRFNGDLTKISERINKIYRDTGKRCLYITMWQDETKEPASLKEFWFSLEVGPKKDLREKIGEWKRFLKRVESLLTD